MTKFQTRLTALVIFIVMFFAAARPYAVRADDATPPPTAPQATEVPTTDPSTPPPAATDVPAATDAPTDGSTPIAAASDQLSQVPAGTIVILLDSAGTPVPLADSQAAAIIQSGDPIWCPTGEAPGDPDCTSSYADLASLVAALAGGSQPTQGGTIWIQNGTDGSGANVSIDGSSVNYSTWANSPLTVQGGWDGNTNSAGTISGQTTFNYTLSVVNWRRDVTLNDLIFDGTGGPASLTVTTTGNIKLKNVEVKNGASQGAYLSNTGSAGSITVDNSSFHDNSSAATGLYVSSSGNITLHDVVANDNGLGADIYDGGGSGSVFIDGSTFNENFDDGLYVASHGDITVDTSAANDNWSNGATIDNCLYVEGCTGFGSVTVTNSTFDGNTFAGDDIGLLIDSTGTVKIENVSASNGVGGDGADIYDFSNLSIKNSVFNNNSSDINNWGWGLYVGGSGNVTLTDVATNGNFNDSDGGSSGGLYISTAGNIVIDPSSFDTNSGPGMDLRAGGDITIECSQSTNNDSFGINANLPGTLTLNNVTFGGNGAGDTNVTGGGTLVISSTANCTTGGGGGKGLQPLIPVTGGQTFGIDCKNPDTFTRLLPSGEQVVFSLLCDYQGMLTLQPSEALPKPLPDGSKYSDGIVVNVLDGSTLLDPLPTGAAMTISFPVPTDGNFAIMHWNGSAWVEVVGNRTGDGRFEASVNEGGLYVLVTR